MAIAGIDPNSQTWLDLKQWLSGSLAKDMDELAKIGLGKRDADRLRGRIELVRELLDLPAPKRPSPVIESGDYL